MRRTASENSGSIGFSQEPRAGLEIDVEIDGAAPRVILTPFDYAPNRPPKFMGD